MWHTWELPIRWGERKEAEFSCRMLHARLLVSEPLLPTSAHSAMGERTYFERTVLKTLILQVCHDRGQGNISPCLIFFHLTHISARTCTITHRNQGIFCFAHALPSHIFCGCMYVCVCACHTAHALEKKILEDLAAQTPCPRLWKMPCTNIRLTKRGIEPGAPI